MDRKKIRKSISRFAAWVGLILCSLIVRSIPASLIYSFARNLAALGFVVLGKHRRIALDSLEIAFGNEKSLKERRKIAKDCFILMAKSAVELIFLSDKPELMKRHASLEGRRYLDEALSKGKGVVLVSAHFGNFPLMLCKLALEGYAIGAIMRQMRDSRSEKLFNDLRGELKVKTIYSQPRQVCVENTLKALRNNEIVFIPIDQNFGTGGVFVDFFGRKAATATGPVVFALRTKAVILPCFTVRQKDDTHKIIFLPPIDLEKSENRIGIILYTIQKLTDIIESYIRKYPAQWGWIHRRWKSKLNLKEGGV
ncbi:MAG: lysophospholipid acyltransferase family protein [bacterium]